LPDLTPEDVFLYPKLKKLKATPSPRVTSTRSGRAPDGVSKEGCAKGNVT